MKKRLLVLTLLVVCLAALPLLANAETGICGASGNNLTWSLTDDGALAISGTGDMKDFEERTADPSETIYNADWSPWWGRTITNVLIEDGVTSIGTYALTDCATLATATIPASVTSIAATAFSGCDKLTIFCYKDSAAQTYAMNHGIKYELLRTPLKITTQPTSLTVDEGETAAFEIVAEGAETYQWLYHTKDESNWSIVVKNGTEPVYQFTAGAQHDGNVYCCQVKNDIGETVLSDSATLTVKAKPVIKTQPESVMVNEGDKATFTVVAEGADSIQWYYHKADATEWKKVIISGTSATYSLTTEARHSGNVYYCELKNENGTVNSKEATLTVYPKPTITKQPVDKTAVEGDEVTFTVTAENATGYQWFGQKPGTADWTSVSSVSASADYTMTADVEHDGYKYRCDVLNAAGSKTSEAAMLTVRAKVVITSQPTDVTATEDKSVTFKVVADNATGYQWYYQKPGTTDWDAVTSGGTSASYTLTAKKMYDGYQYRCEVSNAGGSVTTQAVKLTVQQLPIITEQPKSLTVNEGSMITFKVGAINATGYRWWYQKPDSSIWNAVLVNGTSAAYTLTTAPRHNGYKYRCLVSGADGGVYSDTVTLKVNLKPAITSQPNDVKVVEGSNAVFTVAASNADSYRWYYQKPGASDWNPVLINGTSATYTLKTELRHNGNIYRCVVTNAVGDVTSATVSLTVCGKLAITQQPVGATVTEGTKVSFKVEATNAEKYQWYYQKPGESIWNPVLVNGTYATYTLTTAMRHNGYIYRCLVSNDGGTLFSDTVTLKVNAKPTITSQPTDVTVSEGATAVFKVEASNATTYRWYYQKPGSTDWNPVLINGTSATYTLVTAARHNGNIYRCVVSNAAGEVTSETAKLTVKSKPIISSHPVSVTVAEGSPASFKVESSNATSYQWYYQKPGESTWNPVLVNGTYATYTVTTAARHNGYIYRCKLVNEMGEVDSNTATLTLY